MGDRMFAEYEIVNVQKQLRNSRGQVQVGQYKYHKVKLSFHIFIYRIGSWKNFVLVILLIEMF